MTGFNPVPWALHDGGAAANPAETVRQSIQGMLAGSGVVNSGDLTVSSNSTPNMTVNVAAGAVYIPGTVGSTTGEGANVGAQTAYGLPANFTSQGCYFAFNTSTISQAINAANATNPRIDLICAAVGDPDYAGGGTSNAVTLTYVPGTPAGSPVPPSAPANSVVLAEVYVGAAVTVINSGNITDKRPKAILLNVDRFGAGEAAPIAGAAPAPGTAKITRQASVVITTNGSGDFSSTFSTAFPNGLQSAVCVPGDISGGVTSIVVTPASTLSTLTGRAFAGGTALASTAIRIVYTATGW